MRLDYSACKKTDLSLLEKIETGYRRKSVTLLVKYLKEDYV